jgi:hypothetical protein
MKKSRSVMLVGVPFIASALIACDSRQRPTSMTTPGSSASATPTHVRVCRDAAGTVLEDSQCVATAARTGAGIVPFWWYMPYVVGGYPSGAALRGGTRVAPSGPGTVVAPNQTVRGGFGSTGAARPTAG